MVKTGSSMFYSYCIARANAWSRIIALTAETCRTCARNVMIDLFLLVFNVTVYPLQMREGAMASRRRLRKKSCDGKKKFTDQESAGRAAAYRTRLHGRWITPYRCKFCGGYHIGHPPRSVRQSLKAKRENQRRGF